MKGERCCSKCRALPGTCALKRQCPCHPRHNDYEPEDRQPPAQPAPAASMFPRPTIHRRP